jgi:hypothetical protein
MTIRNNDGTPVLHPQRITQTDIDSHQRWLETRNAKPSGAPAFNANAAKNDVVLNNSTAQGTLAMHHAMRDTLDI